MKDGLKFACFLHRWHGLDRMHSGQPARWSIVDQLQGYIVPYSDLETRLMPARLSDYQYGELDQLCKATGLVWQGHERLLTSDGNVSVYREQVFSQLGRISTLLPGQPYARVRELLVQGPADFESIHRELGGFPPQLLAALWDMVWAGEVSNRRLLALQALKSDHDRQRRSGAYRRAYRVAGRRRIDRLPGSVGEWYLLTHPGRGFAAPDERDQVMTRQLLARWGIVGQRCAAVENITGGFASLDAPLKQLEASGTVSQGRHIPELGPVQFALPAALDVLNELAYRGQTWMLAASDPANPYGGILPWPKAAAGGQPQRTAGARVILQDGALIGYLGPRGHSLLTFETPNEVAGATDALVDALTRIARVSEPLLLHTINGQTPGRSAMGHLLRAAGFVATRQGYLLR